MPSSNAAAGRGAFADFIVLLPGFGPGYTEVPAKDPPVVTLLIMQTPDEGAGFSGTG